MTYIEIQLSFSKSDFKSEFAPTNYTLDSDSLFIDSLTRSRNSLPGLKCGTYLPGKATEPPVFGLRPERGGR